MPQRIRPEIDEISLAFNPANMKKFHLRKDNPKEGGSNMPKAVDVLNSQDKMFKEEEFIAFLDTLEKDQFSEDDREMILGSFKLLGMVKDRLPEKFIEGLTKAIPELKASFTIVETKEVPADEDKIRKEIKAALQKELKVEKDEVVSKLKDAVQDLRKELDESVKALDKEREIRETAELKSFIKEKNIPGDVDKIARTIFIAKKTNPELGKDIEDVLASSGAALTAAGIFTEAGNSGGGNPSETAYEKIQKMVAEEMKKDDKLDETAAWKTVVRANPELYREYTKEHARQAKEVH